MTTEQFAEIKAWLAWDMRASGGVKLEAVVEDLVAEVERLQEELAKTQRACQTLGKVVDSADAARFIGDAEGDELVEWFLAAAREALAEVARIDACRVAV